MSGNRNLDKGFRDRADVHIRLANEQCDNADTANVCASLLFAAARFNAFAVAAKTTDVEALKRARAEAIEFFSGQFKAMLEDNFNDQVSNYDKYFPRARGGSA